MKLRISLDAGVRCIFDWNSRLSRKQYEIGTDPVNIKHPVARAQHQLRFLLKDLGRRISAQSGDEREGLPVPKVFCCHLANQRYLAPQLAVLVYRITELCTALNLGTCLTFFAALLTCRLVIVYGRRVPANWTSARRVSSLSETVHLPLLGQSSGTVSMMTLHRPHRCQYSERNWKHTYFDNHIRTLFSSLLLFLSPSWSLKLIVT